LADKSAKKSMKQKEEIIRIGRNDEE